MKLDDGTTTYEKNYVHVMDDKSRIAEVRVNGSNGVFPGDMANDVTYVLEDQIGTSVMRLDEYGTEIDKEEYYPFGDSSLRTFSSKRYRYVGKERDSESGLYYYGARYYAAWTCRFISVDSLADKYAHISPYNYADNNPINDFDIDGNQDKNTAQTPNGDSGNSGSKSAAPADRTATKNIRVDQAAINAVNNKQKSANGETKSGATKANTSNAAGAKSKNTSNTNKDNIKPNTGAKSTAAEEPQKKGEKPDGAKSVSTGEERVAKAKEYEGKYTYSLYTRSDSTINCADFVEKVMVQTDWNVAQNFITFDYYSYVPTMLDAIKERGDTLRMTDPKVGDLAFWHNPKAKQDPKTGNWLPAGHVEFVSFSDGTNFRTFGARSGKGNPNEMGQKMGKDGKMHQWLNVNYKGIGGLAAGGIFVGFWTPPIN